jgi:GNAT superfamily N-acetyltransferase
MFSSLNIRKASLNDRAAIQELIAASARHLSQEYSTEQIETAIASVFGVDTDLIDDGTYFVVEIGDRLAGCGGWSRRRTLYGGDQYVDRDTSYLDPDFEPAKIRAFFVHPDFARRGVGRAILELCEREAAANGFKALELMSTLPGIKLYKACGYSEGDPFNLTLPNDVILELVQMHKGLAV